MPTSFHVASVKQISFKSSEATRTGHGWMAKQQIRLAIVFLLLFVIICFGFVVGRYFWIAVHCFTSSTQSLEPFISIDDSWYSCVCFCLLLILKQERRTWGFRHQPPSSQQWTPLGVSRPLWFVLLFHPHSNQLVLCVCVGLGQRHAGGQHQHCWRSFTCGRDSRMNRVLWAHPASNNSISGFLFFNPVFSFFIYSSLTKWPLFFFVCHLTTVRV